MTINMDEVLRRLAALGARRRAIRAEQQAIAQDLAQAIRDARAADISMAEIVRRTGLSKQGAYDLLHGKEPK